MWRKLKPRLPAIKRKCFKAGVETFEALSRRYYEMDKEPLIIKALLGSPYLPTIGGELHVDSILSWAVANIHPAEPLRKDRSAELVFPLPIKLMWVSGMGLPLWCCGDMRPTEFFESREYWHKRFDVRSTNDWGAKPSTPTSRGRFKEYRVPMATRITNDSTVAAICIGNQAEVARLLAIVHQVGKKGTQGFGAVLEWSVEPCEATESMIMATRNVPLDYAGDVEGGKVSARAGWTPPYWYRPWHSKIVVGQ